MGYNDDWQTITNGEIIQFFKVPSGEYTLQIYGRNANGLKGEVKSLSIKITPPFWKTWWFWVALLSLAIILAYRVLQYSIAKKLKQQELAFERKQDLERAKQNERNRIAAEMHDDLGGDLYTIQILLNRIQKDSLQPRDLENLLKTESYAEKSIEKHEGDYLGNE